MALIKPKLKQNKSQMRVSLSESVISEVKAYCDWSGIDKIDDFIEQAIEFVFHKDKAWRSAYQKQKETGK